MDNREIVADTLDAAADYMEEHGWCRGRAMDEEGRVCLIGAIGAVTRDRMHLLTPVFYGARNAVDNYLGSSWNDGAVIAAWNDAENRTKEDAVSVLRKTAIQTREKVDG